MIWAFDAVVDDPAQASTFSRRFFTAALQRGLLLRPIGPTLYFMRPYVLGEAEQRHLAEGALRALDRVLAEEGSANAQASEVPVP